MIQLQRLEGFYRVAKAGGYARAVRAFPYPITEPAVHQQVKKLEAELGQRLLRRVAKDRMALTAPGELLFEFCSPFFERLPSLEGEVRAGGRGGTLRIDAGPLEVRHVLPQWLRQVQRHHPSTRIELREVLRFDVERLRTGATDVIVEHFPNPPRDVTQKLVTKAYGTLVVPSHWSEPGQLALASLRDKPFVSLELESEDYALQLQGLRFLGLQPSRLLSASTVDGILGFVQAGLGFSLIPWPGREALQLSGVTCQRLKVKGAVFPITASFHKSRAPNPLLMAALRLLPKP